MRRTLSVLATLLLLTAGAGLVGASPALAHASLVSTDPEDGASVRTAPAKVTLTFNEVIGQSAVVVTAPDGTRVSGKANSLDRTVSVSLRHSGEKAADQRGRYRVAYRVISADGHPVSGSSTFTTTTGRTVAASTESAPEAQERSFVHRHGQHIFWAVAAAVVGVALIVWPLLRRKKA